MRQAKLTYTLFMSIFIFLSFNTHAQNDDDYRVSTDDEISINVFNEPELNIERVKVSTNGSVSMPLIGEIVVKDLTLAEIESKIKTLLLDGYLKKPNVTVTITEYRPFYISGEVKKPGSYPYRKGLTVQKAITLAGGFTQRASKNTISLITEVEKKLTRTVSLNDTVKPGDVITVSESFF
jgi:polysaccharide biosynthesis/export protein VpsN